MHRLINSRAFPLLYSSPVQTPPREPSMSVDAGSGRCPCPWTWMGFKVSPNPPHSGILGLSRAVDVPGKGPGQTEPFPTGAQPHPSTNPLLFSILHKDPQSQTEGKKICQHFHGRNWIFGSFCTSGMGRFYCLVGCPCTGSIPRTQIHRFGAPSAFLGAQSLLREREEQQTGEHFEG